jgi:hypothetical protein
MYVKEFNNFVCNKISIEFNCPNCQNVIKEEVIVPEPDWEGDCFSDSCTQEEDYFECQSCEKQIGYTIQSSISGGFFYMNDLDDDYKVCLTEESDNFEESILGNTQYYNTFLDQIAEAEKLLNRIVDTDNVSSLQFKLIYSHLITILETYLSDALINTILSNDTFIETFVKTFYKEEKIQLNEVLEIAKNIKNIVKTALLCIVYHRLKKVEKIYKNTLMINFIDTADIEKIISCRHDLIHRNGKDKDGREIIINRKDVEESLKKIKFFIEEIENKLKKIC